MPELMYLPPGGSGRRSRRSFLKTGLFGGVLLAIGGAGFLATRSTRTVPLPKAGLKVLSEDEYAVMAAIAARIVVPRKNFPTVDEVFLAEGCDLVIARASIGVQQELKQLLGLFDNALTNAIFDLRFKPFTKLLPAEQDAVLRDWSQSAFELRRTGYQALRTIAVAAYYGNPKTWGAVGYPGPPPLHDPTAEVWKGGGAPRPQSLGQWTEEAPAALTPEELPAELKSPALKEEEAK